MQADRGFESRPLRFSQNFCSTAVALGVMMRSLVTVVESTAPETEHGPPAIPEFEIVPRFGLVLAAIVLVALIVVVAISGLAAGLHARRVRRRVDGHRPVPRVHHRPDPRQPVGPSADRVHDQVHAEDGRAHAGDRDRDAGRRLAAVDDLGTNLTRYPEHGWVVASMIVVGVMAIVALGLLEPANIAVLIELKKPRPNPEVIEKLMKRFIYARGSPGVMQVATFVIMTKLGAA